MDFQMIADSFAEPTCIISVEKDNDGGYRQIRIVAGNKLYINKIEDPMNQGVGKEITDGSEVPEFFRKSRTFVPNSPYEDYLPKEMGFEEVCFRAAVLKVPVHTYVHLNGLNIWFDIYAMPLSIEDGDICYCTYSVIATANSDLMVSSASSGVYAENVIKTCIKLNGSDDLNGTMNDVIKDIRLLCRADVCTIALIDPETKEASILATSFGKDCKVKRVTQFNEFGDIAKTWIDMFGESDFIVAKDIDDMEYIRQRNVFWYNNLMAAGVDSLVMFPLRYDGVILGFMWATNFAVEDTIRIKETLELTTFFISSKLSNCRMMEHLKQISYTDQLTGIFNRFACTELIESLIKRGEKFCIVSIDINNFKSINDSLGFDAGNRVLAKIASRWKKIAENNLTATQDHIARMGGDEFQLVIQGYENDAAVIPTIKTYENALGNSLTIDGCDLYISASFGYCLYPDDAVTSDSLISSANASMNEIKRLKNSQHIMRFSPELLKEEHTLEIERKLIYALENDLLYFNLQPQFDLDHKLRGFEALARMKDSDGAVVSPGEFIPVAEKMGLIDKVDGAVFRRSAMFIGEIIRETGADIMLSVNISVRHLMKNDFLDEVKDILSSSGIPADHLEIEITESIMIDSAEKAQHCIEQLHKMGIQIAIDDFGTGYSSLSYLNNFPANILKIDKSFIDKMNTSDPSKQYVAAIISIGHIMGFEVVSEGVEEKEQLATLKLIGCDYIQGFIWGRPLSPEDAEKLIRESMAKKYLSSQ
ncbi:putative bifunctional diguanylate cyclase/phosphodiesterase [Ruminococcus albus]|uniref:Diguanylate cyclase (GGDEF) domain-containing protein n=1 Tax=Ruminococcus albus TaxID=1264 RepID=A0A1H7LMA6_RUMAL|nr:bifunctional diguanylate cyclase/phosphodiesterase [Ruminococcus albus]SEL00094.1 diguanylate cyclase (GGDEF) domain-containing protein [Ruminococcus albus]